MDITDQTGSGTWKDIIRNLDGDDFWQNPADFLSRRAKVDSTLIKQVERLRNLPADKDRLEMWNALKALAEGQLRPEQRREIICKLAESYRGFIGWEGDAGDEPGW